MIPTSVSEMEPHYPPRRTRGDRNFCYRARFQPLLESSWFEALGVPVCADLDKPHQPADRARKTTPSSYTILVENVLHQPLRACWGTPPYVRRVPQFGETVQVIPNHAAPVIAMSLDCKAARGLCGHCYESVPATLGCQRPTYTAGRTPKLRVEIEPRKLWIAATQSRRVVFTSG